MNDQIKAEKAVSGLPVPESEPPRPWCRDCGPGYRLLQGPGLPPRPDGRASPTYVQQDLFDLDTQETR